MNNQAVKHKKQKGKRKISNIINNNEIIKETKIIETEDNSIKMKENQDEEEINNKIIPPKKKAK